MVQLFRYKTKQLLFVLIKLGILICSAYFIHYKLTQNNQLSFSVFTNFLTENNVFSIKNTSILIVLSSLNWFFEILKWKVLVSHLKRISFIDAVEQSLGSLTASLFTPNRIGEYGAKAMYYKSHLRKWVMGINLLSNSLQMAVTTFLGVVGLCFYITSHHIPINYFKLIIGSAIVALFVFLIILSLNHKKLRTKVFSVKTFFLNFPKSKIGLGLLFSIIRYAIFSFQFYLLLSFSHVNVSYITAMSAITSMYLIASMMPSIFIFDVLIKGSVAVYLFTFIGVNEITILTIITLMWLLNFVLPSLFGSYYVLRFKLPKPTIKS